MQRRASLVVLLIAACGSPTAPPASHPAGGTDAAAAPAPAPTPTSVPTPPAGQDAGVPSSGPDASLAADAAPAAVDVAAPTGPAEVRFVARVDRTDPAGPRFAWSGSTILARFTGASIGVRL